VKERKVDSQLASGDLIFHLKKMYVTQIIWMWLCMCAKGFIMPFTRSLHLQWAITRLHTYVKLF